MRNHTKPEAIKQRKREKFGKYPTMKETQQASRKCPALTSLRAKLRSLTTCKPRPLEKHLHFACMNLVLVVEQSFEHVHKKKIKKNFTLKQRRRRHPGSCWTWEQSTMSSAWRSSTLQMTPALPAVSFTSLLSFFSSRRHTTWLGVVLLWKYICISGPQNQKWY